MDNSVRIDVEGQVITLPLKYDPTPGAGLRATGQ